MEETISTIMEDGKKRVTSIKCTNSNCPYNQENSPVLRSNASMVHADIDGEMVTIDEMHSGRPCPFGVVHRIITETKY